MRKMARTRKTISIDEKIAQAKENFEKAKAKYDNAAKELEDLQEKQRSIQRNELIKAVGGFFVVPRTIPCSWLCAFKQE